MKKIDFTTPRSAEAFAETAFVHTPSVPLDLTENRAPSVWESDFGCDPCDWNGRRRKIL